jgi:4-hydroxy-tetrahydrodipicolinate synthase
MPLIFQFLTERLKYFLYKKNLIQMGKELKGVVSLPPTPIKENGEIDEESLKKVIDFQLDNGCDGVGVLAGIGEGYLMSDKDWETVARVSIDYVNGRAPILIGIAAMGTGKAIELLKKAEDLGADAVLAFNPLGFGPCSIEGLYKHYKAITDARKSLQVVPYARADDPIPFDVLKRLVDEDRILYMKYAFRNPPMLQQICEKLGSKLFVFCGADAWTLRYLILGCKGIMTASAAVLPKEHVELLHLVEKGNLWDALKLWYEKIVPWNEVGFYENWQIAHKLALKEMGVISTYESPPSQGPIRDYQISEIKRVLRYLRKI